MSDSQNPKKTGPAIHRICNLLQNLHTQTIRKTSKILLFLEDRQQNNYHRGPTRLLQSNQYSPNRSLWSRPQTTNQRTTIRHYGRRQLQDIRIRTHDRRTGR